MERTSIVAGHDLTLGVLRLREGLLIEPPDVGVQERLGLVQAPVDGLDHLHRRDSATADLLGKLQGGQVGEISRHDARLQWAVNSV